MSYQRCNSCNQPTAPQEFYEGSLWCRSCVEVELSEQRREDNARVRPEIIQT